MSIEAKKIYEFGSFRLDVSERLLLKNDIPVALTPKAFDVLAILVLRGGHLVEKAELLRIVWMGSFVEEANIARTIHTLRKILGEDASGGKFIETVAKKGYRFIAEIRETNASAANLPVAAVHPELPKPKVEQTEWKVSDNTIEAETRKNDFQKTRFLLKNQRNFLLVSTVGTILILSVIGFWSAGKSWLIKPNMKSAGMPQTLSGEAFQNYKEGKNLLDRKLKGDNKLALAKFEKAIELDPNYAAAYVGKADTQFWIFLASKSHDDIAQARTALNKSLELDDTNSYAHTLLCRIKVTYDWDFEGGAKECRQAIELDPNSPEAHGEWALFLNVLGREDEALAEIDAAVKLAPTSFNKRSRGLILYYSRRYDEAIAQLQQTEVTDANFLLASKWLMRSYEMKNDYNHAFETRLRQMGLEGATPDTVAAQKAVYEKNGWKGVLSNMLDKAGQEPQGKGFGFTERAIMYCQLGENKKAFEFLEKAVSQRELFLTLIKREPRLDPIRNDSRFIELVKRIGLK